MRKTVFLLSILILMAVFLCGCRFVKIEEAERRPLEYTVAGSDEIPKELQVLIDEKKQQEFQMTYQNGEDFYLIKGYGQQLSGGFSIQVTDLSLSDTAVFFETKLIGPSEESQGSVPSYPYIVVKMQYREEPVQFQ